jgi:hypothetical protein
MSKIPAAPTSTDSARASIAHASACRFNVVGATLVVSGSAPLLTSSVSEESSNLSRATIRYFAFYIKWPFEISSHLCRDAVF